MKYAPLSPTFSAALMLSLIAVCAGHADTVRFGGETHTGVYVREGGAMYYVQRPEDGSVVSVRKDAVESLELSDDAEREALLAEWRLRRGEPAPAVVSAPEPPAALRGAVSSEAERGRPGVLRLRGTATADAERAAASDYATDGQVGYVRLEGVPLSEALKVILRQQNLDYEIRDGYVFISTPDVLRHEAVGGTETRTYQFNDDSGTLPKIVLRNPMGVTSGSFGQGSFGGVGGSFSGGNRGNVGGGFGNTRGGFGGNQFGGGGFGGNQGFGGGGNFRGGGGFGGSDVTSVSNISDLFSTIDDSLVGEEPANIGISTRRR